MLLRTLVVKRNAGEGTPAGVPPIITEAGHQLMLMVFNMQPYAKKAIVLTHRSEWVLKALSGNRDALEPHAPPMPPKLKKMVENR